MGEGGDAKRSTITIETEPRNRISCNSLFMINLASGMDYGSVRPTTTTTTKSYATKLLHKKLLDQKMHTSFQDSGNVRLIV